VLSNALFASWLLGVAQVQEFSTQNSQASFAESGDDEEKAGKKKKKQRTPDSALQTSFDLPPRDAIDYFQAKKIVRKKVFDQLSKEAKQSAFSVSRVYKEDVLEGFKNEIDSALRTGATQQQTVKRFKDILSGASHRELGEFHLETIFRTNMQTAYGVGRRRGLEEVSDAFPFWQYHAVMDDRTRPRHAAINGVILPADNPFWDEHYPPWAFNCRCSVTPTDAIPGDYNPAHPAGDEDVTVSYGDDGAPAKAEIGTSLIDLMVGNFAGVARGASLLDANEAGVERSKASRSQGSGVRSQKE
jgi:SPP1 gp7 family putative phage head morphogenesis protein